MLWMAKSETYGCDAHSSRCTQLSIDMTLAVEHNRVGVYFLRRHSNICAERATIWGMSVECWHKERAHDGVGDITDGTVSITNVRRRL